MNKKKYDKIGDNKVDNTKLDDNKVYDNKVDNTKLDNHKIYDNKVHDNKIYDNKVDDTKLDDNKVDDKKVDDNNVDDTKLDDKKVDNTKLDDNKVDNTKLDDKKVDDKKVDDKKVDDKKIYKNYNQLYNYYYNEKIKNNITVFNCIKENYISYIFILISVIIIAYPNILNGFITFFILLFVVYITHLFGHCNRNIFNIIHHYHHENDNMFSYISQILIELTTPLVLYPIYLIFGTFFLNAWIVLFVVLFYSSIHNINYGIFHVNNVHSLHHEFMETNIGPDICDVVFNTKNLNNTHVENTNHYIPNIIIITLIIVLIKYLFQTNNKIKDLLLFILKIFLLLSVIILNVSSIYLAIYYK